jgi:hypothetical protein
VRTWEFLETKPEQLFAHQQVLASAVPGSPLLPKTPTQSSVDFDFDPRKLLRRKSSLVIDDLSTREKIKEMIATGNLREGLAQVKEAVEKEKDEKVEPKGKDEKEKKPPPTQFQEPDANSLLDAFGF